MYARIQEHRGAYPTRRMCKTVGAWSSRSEPAWSRDEAADDIRDYLDGFYNPRRRHSELGGISPIQFAAWEN